MTETMDQPDLEPHFSDLAPRRSWGWARYVAGIILTLLGTMIFGGLIGISAVFVDIQPALQLLQSPTAWVDLPASQDHAALIGLAIMFSSVACVVVITPLVAKILHRQKVRTLFTGRSRFSMRIMFLSGATFLVLQMSLFFVVYLIEPGAVEYIYDGARFWPYFVLVLLLVPFQCLAEEVFFRGYILQGVSAVTRLTAFRLLVPAVLFALMHAWNPDWEAGGIWAAALFLTLGLYLGFLTLRFNGLETASGLHIANNLMAFSFLTSSGAGFPVATVFYDAAPSYSSGFFFMVPLLLIHFWVVRWLVGPSVNGVTENT